MSKLMLFHCVLVILMTPLLAHSDLKCGSKLVTAGDTAFEVLNKCGEPLLIESWEESRSLSSMKRSVTKDVESGVVFVEVEQWTYNFGPNTFIQFLTFTDGRLLNVESGPKGILLSSLNKKPNKRCGHRVKAGDSRIEVLKKCGFPHFKQVNGVTIVAGTSEASAVLGRTDEWTYNFGPRHFLYHIKFFQGAVLLVERGDYGF